MNKKQRRRANLITGNWLIGFGDFNKPRFAVRNFRKHISNPKVNPTNN